MRRILLASTVVLAALALLPSVGAASCAQESACAMTLMEASIASPNRPIPEILQGDKHLALTGNKQQDLRLIEELLRHFDAVRLSLDPADWVIVELALTRSGRPYRLQPTLQPELLPKEGSIFAGLTDLELSPVARSV